MKTLSTLIGISSLSLSLLLLSLLLLSSLSLLLSLLLDFKRDKKAKDNKNNDDEWVLSSFHIDY